LYSKINHKIQDKIKQKEFIDMSDILVDHHPADVDQHLAVKQKRVGLTSGKNGMFYLLKIEQMLSEFFHLFLEMSIQIILL
jgi:hypothetical protein